MCQVKPNLVLSQIPFTMGEVVVVVVVGSPKNQSCSEWCETSSRFRVFEIWQNLGVGWKGGVSVSSRHSFCFRLVWVDPYTELHLYILIQKQMLHLLQGN